MQKTPHHPDAPSTGRMNRLCAIRRPQRSAAGGWCGGGQKYGQWRFHTTTSIKRELHAKIFRNHSIAVTENRTTRNAANRTRRSAKNLAAFGNNNSSLHNKQCSDLDSFESSLGKGHTNETPLQRVSSSSSSHGADVVIRSSEPTPSRPRGCGNIPRSTDTKDLALISPRFSASISANEKVSISYLLGVYFFNKMAGANDTFGCYITPHNNRLLNRISHGHGFDRQFRLWPVAHVGEVFSLIGSQQLAGNTRKRFNGPTQIQRHRFFTICHFCDERRDTLQVTCECGVPSLFRIAPSFEFFHTSIITHWGNKTSPSGNLFFNF